MYQEIMFAIMSGETAQIRDLLLKDKNVVILRDKAQRTLLMEAIIFKKEDIVELLVKNGADVNARELKGWTPLHFAAQSYLPDTVKLLIEKGADINAVDFYNNTPLHKALSFNAGRGEIIVQLLKAGADRNIPNNSGITPYQDAKTTTNFNYKQFFE
jgi:ankyrin repeat protein